MSLENLKSSQPVDFDNELETVAAALEQCLEADRREGRGPGSDLRGFYQAFRASHLPFLPLLLRDHPHELFSWAAKVVWRVAGLSPAAALAVENHFYVLSAIATLPSPKNSRLHQRRQYWLDQVWENRWLVANTNSRIHGDQIAKTGTVAKVVAGGFEVSGRSVYMSLASEGDLIVFVTFLETGEPAIFASPLQGHPAIEVGDLIFPEAMQDSDTRSVTFRKTILSDEHLLVSGREQADILLITTFQLIWHQTLLAALSLGVTRAALGEGRRFLQTTRKPDGSPLAELDGCVVDFGRQTLRYHGAQGSLAAAGRALARVARAALEHRSLNQAFEIACAAKYHATACAEEVVGEMRRLVGARSFTGDHALERLSREVMFGSIGGEVNAFIERRTGESALGEQSFLKRKTRRRSKRPKSLASLRAKARARKADLDSTVRSGEGVASERGRVQEETAVQNETMESVDVG